MLSKWVSRRETDLDGNVFASRSGVKYVDCALHEVLHVYIRLVQCHEACLHFLKAQQVVDWTSKINRKKGGKDFNIKNKQ